MFYVADKKSTNIVARLCVNAVEMLLCHIPRNTKRNNSGLVVLCECSCVYVFEKTRLKNVGQSYFDPGGDFDLEVVLDPELA